MKYILVTGATSGIGEAITKYLIQEGYYVVACGRNEEKLSQLKEKLGRTVETICCDLTDVNAGKNIFEECYRKGIVFDGFIYSAGVPCIQAARNCDVDVMEKTFRVNTESCIAMCSTFIRKKYSNDASSIVVVSSLATSNPVKGQSVYVATKAALEGYVKALAIDASDRKIRVNAISPAFTNTPMVNGPDALITYSEENIKQQQPLGIIEPRYLAYLAEFLLSDKSVYITGSVIPVSGGAF